MVLLYSRQAHRKINRELSAAEKRSEAGGVLIGYYTPVISVVRDITATHATNKTANVEFILDGKLHAEMTQKAINTYWPTPRFLGIWHSHISMSMEFSTQDKKSNQILAQKFDGILSSIVTSSNGKIRTWYITVDGCEKPCCTILLGKE